nr:DUF4403 family protein [uncultured Holophaga sp.]
MRVVLPLLAVFSALLPAQDLSPGATIPLPVRINLDPVLGSAEQRVPRVPPGIQTWTPVPGSSTKVFRFNLYRDGLMVNLNRNQVTVRTPVHYWMEVGLQVRGLVKSLGVCGLGPDGFRQAWLGAQADFWITPQWGVDLHVSALDPLASNPCTITFLDYDITGQVLAGMKDAMTRGVQGMEQQVRGSGMLRAKAEEVWRLAQQPLEVSPGIFLMLGPRQVRLGPWQSEGHVLIAMPEIEAAPYLQFGARPQVGLLPLPNLELAQGGSSPVFRVRVGAELPFTEATAQLRRQLAGHTFETEKGRFEVRDVRIQGQEGRVLLEVDLKGKVDGHLALVGTPVIDPATGALELKDLDYTLESRSWITHFAEWLFRSTLRKTLGEKANWFLHRNLDTLRGQVQAGLNRELAPGVSLHGQLDRFSLAQPQVLADRFRVDAYLEGQVQVALSPQGF